MSDKHNGFDLKYRDFELLITRDGKRYKATVTLSPSGTTSSTFGVPFTPQEVEYFFDELDKSLEDTSTARESVKRFGNKLFKAIFSREIYSIWRDSLPKPKSRDGLRLRLRLTGVPELALLPWEYLFDENEDDFIALYSKTPVVRYLDVPKRQASLFVPGPMRVLVMIASPEDCFELDVDRELEQLNESLKDLIKANRVILHPLCGEEATLSGLQKALQQDNFHIFHFIGHAGFDQERKGCLLMENWERKTHAVSGEILKTFLGDHGWLKLVVINACDSSRASHDDPFAGLAQSLFRSGIPAIVAMRMAITDSAAITFSSAFYQAIANYYPVDAALAEARKAIYGDDNHVEWATPSLYLNSTDGQLFDKTMKHVRRRARSGDHYENMIEGLMKGEVVVFLGPGANLCSDSHPPDDLELTEHLSGIASPNSGTKWGLPRLSQYVETIRSREFLHSRLRACLDKNFDPPPLHRLLAQLPSLLRDRGSSSPYQLIVTSNYDDALETAFCDVAYDLVCYNAKEKRFYHTPPGGTPELVPVGGEYIKCSPDERTVILKIHGAFDRSNCRPDSYAITEDNYIAFPSCEEIRNIIPIKLYGKLSHSDSKFLFLGWRLVDWSYRVILDRLWTDQNCGGWVVPYKPDLVDMNYWKRKNVEILDLFLEDYVVEMTSHLEQRLP